MTSRACSTEYRLKHPCGKAAGVLCRICMVIVLLCRGGRLCPPCMTAPYHPVGDGVPSARQRRAVIARSVATRQSVFLFWGDGFPRQCEHWLGMTGSRGGRLCPSHQRRTAAQRPIANTGGKNCQIRHFAQISRRMLADVPKFRKLREITCKRHAAVVHLHYTS